MRNSSESFGLLASALAKAQTQLVNPEKTLTATIPLSSTQDRERTFHYASLSSGLEIVRKALGKEEIAVIQTTEIERKSNLIQLTTTLAHSSGEWLASVWPVCSAGEATNPQRLGAALTYARRYALFTLVGIAGEDDLDAPESGKNEKRQVTSGSAGEASFTPRQSAPSRVGDKGGRSSDQGRPATATKTSAVLTAASSAQLRDRLLEEIGKLGNSDEAASWAQQHLPEKNTLNAADVTVIEARFQNKISAFGEELFPDLAEEETTSSDLSSVAAPAGDPLIFNSDLSQDQPSAKLGLPPKIVRLRDKEHCRFVARQPCLVCGRIPTDPHHLRFAQPRALGRRVSDEYTVPICRTHHRELHLYGDEVSWWAGVAIDPIPQALELWRRSRLGDTAQA